MKNNERYLESISSQFVTADQKSKTLFISSPSDIGVRRNGGRNGSRFAPTALLSTFKKMNHHLNDSSPFKDVSLNSQVAEACDFEQAQDINAKNFKSILSKENPENLIHLGGGHDHAYVLLKAINEMDKYKNILIINIDAHCDTRVDTTRHSGTPFRDFDKLVSKPSHIIQYGIHLFANGKSTLVELENLSEKRVYLTDNMDQNILDDLPFKVNDETFIYFSLDCDALESSVMEAVSAVNHHGLTVSQLRSLIDKTKAQKGTKAFGIYEYNPVFDNLSQKGSRTIAGLIYHWLS
jgi:formiminoglutamase